MQNPNSSEDPANPGKAKQSAPPTKHRSQIKEEGTGSEKGIPSEHDAVEEQEINKYKDSIKKHAKRFYGQTVGIEDSRTKLVSPAPAKYHLEYSWVPDDQSGLPPGQLHLYVYTGSNPSANGDRKWKDVVYQKSRLDAYRTMAECYERKLSWIRQTEQDDVESRRLEKRIVELVESILDKDIQCHLTKHRIGPSHVVLVWPKHSHEPFMFKVKSCMSELRALQDAEERLADESKHAELREHMLARLRGDVEDSDREEW